MAIDKKDYALASALYALNAVAEREGLEGECDGDGLCRGLCEEAGCIDYKRDLIRRALLPKTLVDFGYPEEEAE